MKIIGVIPARFGSVRFPGKPLFEIAGKPLLQWVLEGSAQSQLLSEIIVATDDERIAKLTQKCGFRAIMTDSSLASGTDRVWQAAQKIEADVVLNIQGDEPLINGSLVDLLAGVFTGSGTAPEMATLGHPLAEEELSSPSAVKVLLNQFGDAIYFSRFAIPYSRHDAKEVGGAMACLKHIGLYGFQKKFLEKFCAAPPALIEKGESLEQLRALYLGARIRVLQVEQGLQGVDTPHDAETVARLLSQRL